MIGNNKILALIPARGGSKGIKNKNIISLAGKPLIGHTIDMAHKSKYIDSVIVSTDCQKISSVALQHGAKVPFIRPEVLASDTAKTIEVVVHALQILKDLGDNYDILILLQPTSPLRNNVDIDRALECFIANGFVGLASLSEVATHPLLIRTIEEKNMLTKLFDLRSDIRRQDMAKYYYVNGAIYINKIEEINENTSFNDNNIGYIMPKERSIDIDEVIDLIITESIIKMKNE